MSRRCSCPYTSQVDLASSNGTPKAMDLIFGLTVTDSTAPTPQAEPPNPKNPQNTTDHRAEQNATGHSPGPTDDFLPPETNQLIQRLTPLSRGERLQAIRQISRSERGKIRDFLQQEHMKGMQFGNDLTSSERETAETLAYIFEHVFARPGEVKTLSATPYRHR